jgi:uncharacterized protein (AIM24 family)
MQFVEIELDPQEGVVAESGSFMMMDSGIKMDAIFGDGSGQSQDILGKLFSAGKRLLTGESLFMTVFMNVEKGKKNISFAAPYPGKIIPIELTKFNGKFICQKDAFLCAAKGVTIGIEFSKKLGRGLFGGEGLFFASLTGPGIVYIQSLPFSRLASRVIASAPRAGGKSKGEGSILGGIGDLLDGDNRF